MWTTGGDIEHLSGISIDVLAAPRPEGDGVKDRRPAAARRAHALVDIIRRAITHPDLPAHGG
ncbi:MAG: hypothetical protein ABJA16_04350 [Nakamurella sp.]